MSDRIRNFSVCFNIKAVVSNDSSDQQQGIDGRFRIARWVAQELNILEGSGELDITPGGYGEVTVSDMGYPEVEECF
jgi:hypothetical protein